MIDDALNAEDIVHAEPKLHEMMKAYKESQAKSVEWRKKDEPTLCKKQR